MTWLTSLKSVKCQVPKNNKFVNIYSFIIYTGIPGPHISYQAIKLFSHPYLMKIFIKLHVKLVCNFPWRHIPAGGSVEVQVETVSAISNMEKPLSLNVSYSICVPHISINWMFYFKRGLVVKPVSLTDCHLLVRALLRRSYFVFMKGQLVNLDSTNGVWKILWFWFLPSLKRKTKK